MKNFWGNLFALDEPESDGQILYYRIFELVAAYWVLFFAWGWGVYMQRITDVILPLGLANYVDVTFLYANGLSLVNAALITVTFLAGFFRLWRPAYLVCLGFLHFQYIGRYSLGEISHGSNVIGVALLAMALGAVLFTEGRHSRRFTFGFIFFFLGLGYTSAAISKLVASGPMWVDGSHLWMWIQERAVDTFSISGLVALNPLQELTLAYWPLATAILSFGILTEFFGFLMWFRKTRIPIMLLMITMHVGILLSMSINFPANNALLLALALPWGKILDRLADRWGAVPLKPLAQRFG